jgi:hypothetical protein
MYLIIGDERDSCALAVRSGLERRGRAVVVSPNPFGPTGRLRWRFDTETSTLEYTCTGGPADHGRTLEGVFVRSFIALQDITGWTPEDAAYMRSEGMATLLAWLHVLACPVVGRPSDDAWYRPQRSLPEWVGVFAACGLTTPEVVVTNAPGVGGRLAAGWSGQAIYQPMTSPRSYLIHGSAWAELAKVMEHVPVCLLEPLEGPIGAVTLVGKRPFWTNPAPPGRDRLEEGVRRVAAWLESDFVQLSYQRAADGPKFTAVNLQPLLDVHDPPDQERIADEICGRLLPPGPSCSAGGARRNIEVPP